MVRYVHRLASIGPMPAQGEIIPQHGGAVMMEGGPMRRVPEAVARAAPLAVLAYGEVEVVPAARVRRVVQPQARPAPHAGVHEAGCVLLVPDVRAEIKVGAEGGGPAAVVPNGLTRRWWWRWHLCLCL